VRKSLIIISVAASLLLVFAASVDRMAAAQAEDRLADRLRCTGDLSSDPEVTVGGVPFLTQLAQGTFRTIHARLPQATIGRFTATIDATAHDVRLPDGGALHAGSLAADVTVAYADLTGMGAPGDRETAVIGWDGADGLQIQTTVQMLGRDMPITVYATPQIDGNTLTIQPREVELAAIGLRVPANSLGDKTQTRTVQLPQLPTGLHYQNTKAVADGLELTVNGTDLATTGAEAPMTRKCQK
jgi:hypothetical protein